MDIARIPRNVFGISSLGCGQARFFIESLSGFLKNGAYREIKREQAPVPRHVATGLRTPALLLLPHGYCSTTLKDVVAAVPPAGVAVIVPE